MNPLSGVLGEAWQMYKTFAKHLLAIAFVIYLIAAIITALLALAGGTIGILLGSFVSVVAVYLLQATLVKAVQDVRDGRADLSISETVNQALPFFWSVLGASILAGIAITIGLVLIIVPGLFLITIWAVIVPVIVIERSGALASFGRSRELVRVEHYGKGAPPETTRFVQPRRVPAVTGAFMSFRRDWFERLGGFTEDFVFGHYEDADLCPATGMGRARMQCGKRRRGQRQPDAERDKPLNLVPGRVHPPADPERDPPVHRGIGHRRCA